jgi:hypothetical protein
MSIIARLSRKRSTTSIEKVSRRYVACLSKCDKYREGMCRYVACFKVRLVSRRFVSICRAIVKEKGVIFHEAAHHACLNLAIL